MLSGQVKPCSVGLNGIDPQGNVKNQLRAVASGDLELRLIFEGKGTDVTIQGAMYVPGIVYTLVAERDMGEAGFDVCKRNMGRNLFIEKSGKIVGKYTSTRDHHGVLYLDSFSRITRRTLTANHVSFGTE